MKIEVCRTNIPEADLSFTIKVSNPYEVDISEDEIEIVHIIETCLASLECKINPQSEEAIADIKSALHDAKSSIFRSLLEKLKFSIENDFRPKFKPICQEIYNWIYDHQKGDLKQWMQEFDPQRTRYYFDNDVTPTKFEQPQESEHDGQG